MAEESAVSCVSVSNVIPARPTQKHKMFLSTFDLVCQSFPYINLIQFYNISSQHLPSVFHQLKTSLSSVLVHFYPLAGRLVIDSSNPNAFQIDCNDAGAELIHASANISFSELEADHFKPRPVFRRMVMMGNSYRSNNCDAPLLSVQVTEFVGGGVCVGGAMSHVAADGHSCFHFLKSLGELNRGLPISVVPFHDRTVLRLDGQPSAAGNEDQSKEENETIFMQQSQEKEAFEAARISSAETGTNVHDGGIIERKRINEVDEEQDHIESGICYERFCFSGEAMEGFKRLASLQDGKNRTFSSFVAFGSHFWRCMMRAREATEEENVYFILLADCRHRLKPALPPNYFGNCLSMGLVGTRAGKLLNAEGVRYGARLIYEAVNTCSDQNIKDLMKRIESNDNVIRNIEDLITRVEPNNHLGVVDEYNEIIERRLFVNAVGSPRFDLYGIDYGCGRALSVQPGAMLEYGSMFLFGGRDGTGSVDVWTALSPHHMERFRTLIVSRP